MVKISFLLQSGAGAIREVLSVYLTLPVERERLRRSAKKYYFLKLQKKELLKD